MANDDQTVLNEMTRDMSNEVIEKPGQVEWASNFDDDPFTSKPSGGANVDLNAVKIQNTFNDGAWGSPDFDPFAAAPVQAGTAPSGFDSNPFGGSSNDPFAPQKPVEQPSTTGFGDAFGSDPFSTAKNASIQEFNKSQQQQKSEDEQMRLALERSRIEQ
jgi:hypothetical protein